MKSPRIVALCMVCLGCSHGTPGSPIPADLVLQNGRIYTMDLALPEVTGLAVSDGRITMVGTDEEAAAWIGPDTVVEDLGGRAVLPGFVDAHTHLVWGGESSLIIDLTVATSMDELLAAVTAYATANPDEAWVQGSGWDAPTFEGQMHKSLLDAIVPDRPVVLTSADGHSIWVNSVALEMAGITAETPDPAGGVIEHDEDGEPTGVLRESASSLVLFLVPPFTKAQDDAGFATAQALALSLGITTVIDANGAEEVLGAYARADAAGTLRLRVYAAVEAFPSELYPLQISAIAAMRDEISSELLHISGVKFYLDGVLESGTAVLNEPYEDGSNGRQLFTDAQLDTYFGQADGEGLQIHVHAIGDGAVRQMLDAIERLPDQADRRPLAAHIELIDPVDVLRFAELGVYADFQPLWAYPDPYIVDLTIPVIGEDRAPWLYPIGSMAASGATLVAGSDWDVSDMNPFAAMEVAVTRQDPDAPGDVLYEEERVDLATILAAYTRDGARAVFAEDDLGTLTPGKLADLVVLDRDPFAIGSEELSEVKVLSTWVEGQAVFRAE